MRFKRCLHTYAYCVRASCGVDFGTWHVMAVTHVKVQSLHGSRNTYIHYRFGYVFRPVLHSIYSNRYRSI